MATNNGDSPGSNEASEEIAAIHALVERWKKAVNTAPDEEMGGLSPDTVHRLLYEPWGEPGAFIRFQTSLTPEDLAGAVFYRRARGLLECLQAAGGIKATPKGNLPRAIVAELLTYPEMSPELYAPHLIAKSVNEEDFFPLHTAKLTCRCAGLLLLRKGRIMVTSAGARLLGQDKAGMLFVRLFTAVFRKFNLAYAYGRFVDAPALQQCVGYTLHRLGAEAREWRPLEALYPRVFLPAVRTALESELKGREWLKPTEAATGRVFSPLLDFGLLEGRYQKRHKVETLEAVRVTPLFRKFLVFDS